MLRPSLPAGMSTGPSASAGRPGTRSTASPTVARSSASSARLGPSAGDRRPATTPSVWPRSGCATCSTRPGAARCRVSSGRAPPSPTPRRVPALHRARPRTQALHRAGLPLARQRADPAQARASCAGGRHDRACRGVARSDDRKASTRRKALVLLHGIFQRATKVYGLADQPRQPTSRSRRRAAAATSTSSRPEEVWALVRAAAPSRTRRSS